MGIVAVKNLFKKLASQWNSGFFYVVDGKTLKMVLEKDIEFSKKNKLEAINEFYLYLDGKQHHVMVWDYSFSSKEKKEKRDYIFPMMKKSFILRKNSIRLISIKFLVTLKLNYYGQMTTR